MRKFDAEILACSGPMAQRITQAGVLLLLTWTTVARAEATAAADVPLARDRELVQQLADAVLAGDGEAVSEAELKLREHVGALAPERREALARAYEKIASTHRGTPVYEELTGHVVRAMPGAEGVRLLERLVEPLDDFTAAHRLIGPLAGLVPMDDEGNKAATDALFNLYKRLDTRAEKDPSAMKRVIEIQSAIPGILAECGAHGFDRREQLGFQRSDAVVDWGKPGSGRGVGDLVAKYRSAGTDDLTKYAILRALLYNKELHPLPPEARQLLHDGLEALLKHPEGHWRLKGAELAGSSGDPSLLPLLEQLAASDAFRREEGDRAYPVRMAAEEAAEDIRRSQPSALRAERLQYDIRVLERHIEGLRSDLPKQANEDGRREVNRKIEEQQKKLEAMKAELAAITTQGR